MYLKNIEEIRKVQLGRTYLWDIRFIGGNLPKPFQEWFPAINVDEGDGSINSISFDAGYTSAKIPQNKTNAEIKVTFIDKDFEAGEDKYNLYEWMKAWRNQVVIKPDGTIGTLSEIVRHLVIAKLNTKKEIVKTSSYWVYPEGDLSFVGNSENGIPTYSINLVVAG